MKQRTLLALAAVILVGASLFAAWRMAAPGQVAEVNVETFARANQLYQNGNYAAATSIYEQLVANGIENADLFYNLGLSLAAMGNAGRSDEMFAAARALAPRDAQIAATGGGGLPLTENETLFLVLASAGLGALVFVLLSPRILFKKGASV